MDLDGFWLRMISFKAPGNLTVCEQDNQQLKTANHGSYVSSLEDYKHHICSMALCFFPVQTCFKIMNNTWGCWSFSGSTKDK